MANVIDDTLGIIESMGLAVSITENAPGCEGLHVELHDGIGAYFVWEKMSLGDFRFRGARFINDDQPFHQFVCPNIPMAIAKIRFEVEEARRP